VGESSFHTNLDPELRVLGDVSPAHQDVVALAGAVFLADRTIPRPRAWRRSIELKVPVYDPDTWTGIEPALSATLDVLSSDGWSVGFRPRKRAKPGAVAEHVEVDRVLLFSGGADSLCGAIRSLAGGERMLFVSHWDWAGHAAVQKRLARWLARQFHGQVWLHQIQFGRRDTQVGTRQRFGNEVTRRARSFLFLALGLADASVGTTAPLWIAENGYVALNPPLVGERRGALSTRTTHPLVLHKVRRVLRAVGCATGFQNPFAEMTKGEMYKEVANALGIEDAATVLAMSHSCAHVRYAIGTGYPPETQCGVCFGCLVRRAAFAAAGLPDGSTYLHKAIAIDRQPPHLRATAISEVRAVRYAATRGVAASDLLAMGLPDELPLEVALDVAQRGLQELAWVLEAETDLMAVP
jgi:7-cyano-7-deazaguanine synthase in queuosine biosynthesis